MPSLCMWPVVEESAPAHSFAPVPASRGGSSPDPSGRHLRHPGTTQTLRHTQGNITKTTTLDNERLRAFLWQVAVFFNVKYF